jgi:hypothetical protein
MIEAAAVKTAATVKMAKMAAVVEMTAETESGSGKDGGRSIAERTLVRK